MPGLDDTVRVNGVAVLTRDASVLDACTKEIRRPKLAVVVEVEELFVHCAKAFRRGRLWQPDEWSTDGVPDLAEIYSC